MATLDQPSDQRPSQSRKYFNIIYSPYTERPTIRRQINSDVYAFDQPLGFYNVSANIRMTVVRLEDGGLLVYAPVAATDECIQMLEDLGEVSYILLPTTVVEHKLFVRNFVKRFPKAKVYVAPGQFSWPLNLPLGYRVDGILEDGKEFGWSAELPHATYLFKNPQFGFASECVLFHKKSKTLICTDAVMYVDERTPDIPSALQVLFLSPPTMPQDTVFRKLVVVPALERFVFRRDLPMTREWVDKICKWNFKDIVPAHFSAPVRAGPEDFKNAFGFAFDDTKSDQRKDFLGSLLNALSNPKVSSTKRLPDSDPAFAVLNAIEGLLRKFNVID